MDRQQKEALVSKVRNDLTQSSIIIVTSQVGLTVSEVSDLRKKVRDAGASFKVLKNTLAQIAVKDTDVAGIGKFLKGPTALAYSSDPASLAKVVVNFANGNEKMSVLGGIYNSGVLSASDVKILATLPSLDELRGKIVGLISAPATKLATILQEPAARIARVLQQKSKS
jgi:large subunit ribosomal protein L10